MQNANCNQRIFVDEFKPYFYTTDANSACHLCGRVNEAEEKRDKEEEQNRSRKPLRRIGIMGEESEIGLYRKRTLGDDRLTRMKQIARTYG